MALIDYELSRKLDSKEEKKVEELPSFTPRLDDDGSITVASGNVYGQFVDLDGTIQSDSELITRYRAMSDYPALNSAITAIVNEAIVNEPEDDTVSLDLDKVEGFSDSLKTKINDEFKEILRLLNFERMGYELFRRWYIDGRLYFHAIVDQSAPTLGIRELRYIDPRKIRKVREIKNELKAGGQATEVTLVKEFYLFNETGFGRDNVSGMQAQPTSNSLRISKDAIVHVTSGLMDHNGKSVVSYLHKVIRPLNMLTMLEDAVVIYRLSRAPERRVFYVDVGGMQKPKAEQYMNQLITNMKNKVVYDSATGAVRDQRKFATMFEDIWLPRRGDKGTQVDTLPGGENLGKIEDVEFMQRRLYQSLEVPFSRLNPEDVYSLGRSTEISREEIAFEKFITRLRSRFSLVLLKALRVQLLLKRIITPDDWAKIENNVAVNYNKDNLMAELKSNEVLEGRLGVLGMIQPYIGRYFSDDWVRRTVLRQTDIEIKEMDKEIAANRKNPQYLDTIGTDVPSGGNDPEITGAAA